MNESIPENTALRFVASPFGLEPVRDYTLTPVAGSIGLYSLRPDVAEQTRLFLLDASVHATAYQPVLSEEQCALIALTRAEDAWLFVVVNPGADETSVNLMAPIVVNRANGQSAQVILDDAAWRCAYR